MIRQNEMTNTTVWYSVTCKLYAYLKNNKKLTGYCLAKCIPCFDQI